MDLADYGPGTAQVFVQNNSWNCKCQWKKMRSPSKIVDDPNTPKTGIHAYRVPITGTIDLFSGALGMLGPSLGSVALSVFNAQISNF